MQRKRFRSAVGSAAAVMLMSSMTVAQGPYKVLDHWKVGGAGGWDYLVSDSNAHLLYLTHGPRVEVIDTQTGRSVEAITGLGGTHGVVLDADGVTGYVSDGKNNNVAVFDRKTFKVITTIPVGNHPDGMTWEPTTKTVWAFNGGSNDVSVVDAASRKVIATTKLPGRPEFPQADGKGNIFVNIEDKNSVARLSATTHEVTLVLPLTECEGPSGMAIDPVHHRLFSVCDGGKMAVLDTVSGKQVATASIGDGPDAAGYSASKQLAFSSNGGGTLSVVDAAHGYKTVQTLATMKGARTMAYDAGADRVYLVTAALGPAPAATTAQPRPRPSIVPDTFEVLVIGR